MRAGSAALLVLSVLLAGCGTSTTSPTVSPTAAPSAPAPTISPTASPVPASVPPSLQASASPALQTGKIVFGRKDPTIGFEVFVMNADGSGQRRLLSGSHEIPRWSPDGTRLSMTADGADGLITTAIVAADGSIMRTFRSPDRSLSLGCATWSPDGSRLACEGWDDKDPKRNGVYTIRSFDGGGLVRLTSSPDGAHDIPGSFSPDGSQISFVRSAIADHGQLFVVPTAGGQAKQVSTDDTFASAWSPDGATILTDGLRLITVADRSVRQIPLPPSLGTPVELFGGRWSPDGTRIVFSMGFVQGAGSDIYTIRTDGSDLRRLTDDPAGEEFADWTP